jgi:hypothetical protein
MLLVFLTAAVIAITLYLELPRVAFDAQRQKEQLLIERGEQYRRALQVFVHDNKRWPAKIEDLENFNNRRYLRKRYIDPMTGKDEWRVIHIQNGVLIDSINNKNQNQDSQKAQTTGQFVGEVASIGQSQQTGPNGGVAAGGAAIANRRRASDGTTPGVDTPGGMPPQQMAGMPQPGVGFPQQPGVQVGQPMMPGQPMVPGQVYPGAVTAGVPQPGMPTVPGMPGVPGQQLTPQQIIQGRMNPGQMQQQPQQPAQPAGSSYIGSGSYIGGSVPVAQPVYPTYPQPGQAQQYPQPGQPQPYQPYPGAPGAPVNSQTGGVSPQPFPVPQPGQTPGFPGGQPGMDVTQQSNAAQDMLNRALYGPRPGGAPTGNTIGGAGQTLGSGIAGFASKAEADSIMVYNDHSKYNEWEFIYDPAKQRQPMNPLSAANGTPVAALASGSSSGSNPANPGIGTINALGAVPGTTPVLNAPGNMQAVPQTIPRGYSPLQGNDGSTAVRPVGGNTPSGNPPNSGYGINPIRQ